MATVCPRPVRDAALDYLDADAGAYLRQRITHVSVSQNDEEPTAAEGEFCPPVFGVILSRHSPNWLARDRISALPSLATRSLMTPRAANLVDWRARCPAACLDTLATVDAVQQPQEL